MFTPRGDVKPLPKGATPIDLAYAVHCTIGDHCSGGRVNGMIVPLRYELRNGDTVEIITNPNQKPNKDWLNLVKTARARTKIRYLLRKEQRERAIALGKDILDKGMRKRGLSLSRSEKDLDHAARERETFGILPPGDIRNCVAALSNDEQMMTQLFRYRFSGAGGLDGHSFGNLFINALADITGSFESAVAESGKVLSVSGRVLPSTLHDVRLVADMVLPNLLNQVRVEGESRIPKMAGRVRRVWLEPNDAPAYPPTLKAILSADMIVVGPGSLYTSLLPNLLVKDLSRRDLGQPGPEGLRVQYCHPVRRNRSLYLP